MGGGDPLGNRGLIEDRMDVPRRPELIALSDEQKDRVRGQLHHRRPLCAGCGSRAFLVGDALYLGFLFRSEALGAYRVALTCTDPACPNPYNGITLHEHEFLSP